MCHPCFHQDTPRNRTGDRAEGYAEATTIAAAAAHDRAEDDVTAAAHDRAEDDVTAAAHDRAEDDARQKMF